VIFHVPANPVKIVEGKFETKEEKEAGLLEYQ